MRVDEALWHVAARVVLDGSDLECRYDGGYLNPMLPLPCHFGLKASILYNLVHKWSHGLIFLGTPSHPTSVFFIQVTGKFCVNHDKLITINCQCERGPSLSMSAVSHGFALSQK